MATSEVPPSCHSKCQERDPLELSSLDKDLGFSIKMKILNAVTQLQIDSLPKPMPMPTLITLAPQVCTMFNAYKPD